MSRIHEEPYGMEPHDILREIKGPNKEFNKEDYAELVKILTDLGEFNDDPFALFVSAEEKPSAKRREKQEELYAFKKKKRTRLFQEAEGRKTAI